jgi:hypothetical protein
MEIIMLYLAGIRYFDLLADPSYRFTNTSDEWFEKTQGQRENFRVCWYQERQEFSIEVNQLALGIITGKCATVLGLFNLFEKRLAVGMAACRYVTDVDTTKDWQSRAAMIADSLCSQEVIPWTFNRCKFDMIEDTKVYIDLFNERRIEFRTQAIAINQMAKAEAQNNAAVQTMVQKIAVDELERINAERAEQETMGEPPKQLLPLIMEVEEEEENKITTIPETPSVSFVIE